MTDEFELTLEEAPPLPRESPPTPLERAVEWLTKRSLAVVWLRFISQIVRRFTGAPMPRYSEVTPELVVCGQHWPRGLATMQARGITAVVNMRKEFDDASVGVETENYLHLPTTDNTAPTQEHLREGVEFIHSEIERGGKVYIHCGVGVGRAPTMAAAYLVSKGMTPDEAWEIIRKRRPFVWPNRRQIASVRKFAEEYDPLP